MVIRSIPELERQLEEAARRKATELYLIPGEPPTFRMDWAIVRGEEPPLSPEAVEQIARESVGAERLGEVGRTTGAASAVLRLSETVATRISVARSCGQVTVRCRLLRPQVLDAAKLRVPESIIQAVEAPNGLVVVTGPMGCGKTTTCHALLEHLNATRDVHIIVAEYEIESVFEPKRALIQQRQVGVDTPDMLAAIRSALLQDVDVLFVGELRGLDEWEACLTAAEGGHLVLTQLHQPTAETAIGRMIALQPEETRPAVRELLSRLLRGVLAQRLLCRADGRGRVAAYGALIPDTHARRAIVDGRDVRDRSSPWPPDYQTLADDICHLRDEGIVTPDEAAAVLAGVPASQEPG